METISLVSGISIVLIAGIALGWLGSRAWNADDDAALRKAKKQLENQVTMSQAELNALRQITPKRDKSGRFQQRGVQMK